MYLAKSMAVRLGLISVHHNEGIQHAAVMIPIMICMSVSKL